MYVDFMQAPAEEDLRGEGDDVRHPPHELQELLCDKEAAKCLYLMPVSALRSELQSEDIRKCSTLGSALDMEQRTKVQKLREKAVFLADTVVSDS